jgi:S-adenosylmethionine/arginine decarboxylase-like enzyme
MEEKKGLVHKHLILSTEIKNPPKDKILLRNWYLDLVEKIGMIIVPSYKIDGAKNPIIYDCHEVGNEGMTISGVIETSCISVHTWDAGFPAKLELDVYTCSPLDIQIVFEQIQLFEPIRGSWLFIDREYGLKILGQGVF